jgi:hypothetical protein
MSNVYQLFPAKPAAPEVKPPRLHVGDRPTKAMVLLDRARTAPVAVTVKGQWSDKPLLDRMAKAGWMEEKKSGPKGGRRYHLTQMGAAAAGFTASIAV